MPEELAILLVILLIVGWIIVKIFKALINLLEDLQKRSHQNITEFKKRRYAEAKSSFSLHVRRVIPNELDWAEKQLQATELALERFRTATRWTAARPTWTSQGFKQYATPLETEQYQDMDIDDIRLILLPNSTTWLDEESRIISQDCKYPFPPPVGNARFEFTYLPPLTLDLKEAVFDYDQSTVNEKEIIQYFEEERSSVTQYNLGRSNILCKRDALNQRIKEWNDKSKLEWEAYTKQSVSLEAEEASKYAAVSKVFSRQCEEQKHFFKSILDGYNHGAKKDVADRMNYVLGSLSLPHSIPHSWDIEFDEEQQILIVEACLPDVVHRPPFKTVPLKSRTVEKPLNQTERKELVPKVHPAILLRLAYEVFRNDVAHVVSLLVVNGWISFDDPASGLKVKAYTASLMVEREQIANVNLCKIDPIAAFESMHGKSAGKLVEIIPIEPALSLNKKDARFVDAKAVLGTLGTATNLAAMDWQDFEHLIRELFEREFSGRDAEVKITQASRDRGVDAVVFDPDPIRGGKYVIQAKRYTNTVDVSAVRDLCAVVKKEGASRGILVTTSTYGADAYAFANNEPITLLNGAELLGLLKKHGYSFRINLQEARKLNATNLRRENDSTPT